MFFGKLFGKLERPYFTFIDDYVVFSNSDGQLMLVIDSYIKNKTMSKNASFMNFMDDFDKNANVSLFVQTPKIYKHLYFYGKNDTKESLKKNKDLILSFEKIGFQLISDGDMFKTTLITEHNTDALMDETLENIEKAAEDLYFYDYDSLQFKVDLTGVPVSENVPVQLFYNDKQVMAEGSVIDGKPHGVWKNYYLSGKIQSIIRYEEGLVNGHCIFYYEDDLQTMKAEMDFEKDVMQGDYKEYYQNGNLKALIKVKDYILDGDVEFYYERGGLKAKGQYSEGFMDGKWKYYNETGQEIAKKKYKNGVEKE
jgi:antitoxin component YwqK of YwqJK toxin-antitoxin module